MNTEKYPLVSIITVNYNQLVVTCDLLNSLRKITYPNYEIFVVDNASSENPQIYLNQYFPEANVIVSNENLGFAGGNNLAVRKSNGKYVLFINNDTEVEPNFLEPMVETMESDSSIGITTSKLLYFDKKDIIQYAGSDGINQLTGRGKRIGYLEIDNGQHNVIRRTYLAHGASMMVPIEVIRKIGMMPDLYFLYYEEMDWCEMIKRAGYKIYFVGTSTVYHKESISVGKYNAFKTYFMMRNRILFMRRNTKGFTFLINSIFISIISIPKNILSHLLKGEFDHTASIIRAIKWNLTNYDVHKNPLLSSK